MDMRDTLGVLLAGGAGERLFPLTRDRAKPAVPFGGHYRIIDITLSNCINSGLRKVFILTQYKALSLNRHIREGWTGIVAQELGEFFELMPPMQRTGSNWYMGTADAVYQNIYSIGSEQPKYVIILSAATTSTRWTIAVCWSTTRKPGPMSRWPRYPFRPMTSSSSA
jgi:glucose-1-phosphate adenylyltransferase